MAANLGVIAGIIFLGLELRQNNQLIRAEALGVVLETRMATNEEQATNPASAALILKNRKGENLTELEQHMVRAFLAGSNMGWQRDYFYFQEGILPEEYLRANFPVMKSAFQERGSRMGTLTIGRTDGEISRQSDSENLLSSA